jgi:outer membrane protein assembly factor BamB
MNMNMNDSARKPWRLWPGALIAILQVVLFTIVPSLAPDVEVRETPLAFIAMMAGIGGVLPFLIWWLFFSRAPWLDRIAVVVTAVGALLLQPFIVHDSIAGAHMGVSVYMWPLPALCVAVVVWAWVTQRMSATTRRGMLLATVALVCLPWTLIRTAGVKGAGSEYHWRWTPTPEERLLAAGTGDRVGAPPNAAPPAPREDRPVAAATASVNATPSAPPATKTPAAASSLPPATAAADATPAEWPGFRGRGRDSVVRGVEISTDWAQAPPQEMWRKPVGPGWSSFAVRGDVIYTQEQRGEEEMVSAYRLSTGEAVWRHSDQVRFWESNGGAGPRATPTVDGNRVYAFGATGILNALDAETGRLLWTHNVATDTGRRIPEWGFASSPLLVNDVVVVAAAGTLAAYDAATGQARWKGPSYGGSYSSPHLVRLDGVDQVVLLGGPGAISVAPKDGKVLWIHEWIPGPIVQPAMTADGDIIINAIVATGGVGTRRLHVTEDDGAWKLEERWTSNGLKPYFNDFVVHEGHAYGFDGSIMSSIDLETGTRKWKGGRYGNGQVMLLADQDLLLVISEDGELALVSATPDQYREVARLPVLNSKTWNHPVLVGDTLVVRNGEEMAAFRLPRTTR